MDRNNKDQQRRDEQQRRKDQGQGQGQNPKRPNQPGQYKDPDKKF